MTANELRMTFDPNTIEHLGVRLYSTLPTVLAELIANSHDADAEHVFLRLNDENENKEIVIEDDGIGMSFDEINEKFLRIGRARRVEEGAQTTAKGRKIIGKKGLGKLSFFGISHEIEIFTKKDEKENVFKMKWADLKKEKNEYMPEIVKKDAKCKKADHGTMIILRAIQREHHFKEKELADSLAKMFIIDSNFEISVQRNNDSPIKVTNEERYADLEKQVEWRIPDDLQYKDDYIKSGRIIGNLIATKKPIPPKTNMRGVVLFARKKMVNHPEYFSDSTSSHFFSYLTGWLEIDFIDDLDDDVIATNRQSLNWNHKEMQELRGHLRDMVNWLEKDWRKKREEMRDKEVTKVTGINVSEWFKTMPDEIRAKIEPVVRAIVKDSELSEQTNIEAIRSIHEIVPEYPRYHWRNLHPEVKLITKNYYISNDYYTAFFEAVKRYINVVKEKSGVNLTDNELLENVFSIRDPKLLITEKYKKHGGGSFTSDTIGNITEGHRMLALGVWRACRGPVAHEEVCDLRDSGLFSERDCLDALSLLSHLFYRIDNAIKPVSGNP
jgi:uncharacterized protein (TIGR02391 family)